MEATSANDSPYTLGIIAARGIAGEEVYFNPPAIITNEEPDDQDAIEARKINLKMIELILATITAVVLIYSALKK